MSVVTAGGGSGVPPPGMANSTTFTFSRLSTQPLTSTMTISSVNEGLNGVQMNCVDVQTTESATTTIQFIDPGQLGKTPQLLCSWLVANLSHIHAR